jgi:hypothetical protein
MLAQRALHVDQRPSFWLVAQGRKCLTVGDEDLHYGVGDCLLVALDLPATARITQASEAEPHLCVGVAINPARLAELIGRLPEQASATPGGLRGVAVNPASPSYWTPRCGCCACWTGRRTWPPWPR